MSAHTPGPWVMTGGIKPVGDADKGGLFNHFVCEIFPADDSTYRGAICNIMSADHIKGIDRSEAGANARLIAAAPDMLAVLQWLDRLGGLGLDVHERISDALARATGETK